VLSITRLGSPPTAEGGLNLRPPASIIDRRSSILYPHVVKLRPIAALLPLLLLAGCFQLRALIRVNTDGSGTLEETVLFGGMVRQMMTEADSSAARTLYDVDSLRTHASRLGAAVRLLRVDTLEDGDDFGYRVVYEFEDVSNLRFQFNSNIMPVRAAGQPPGRGSAAMLAGTSPELIVTFARDADGTLRVRMPQSAPRQRPAPLERARVAVLTDSLRQQMGSAGAAVSEVLDGMRLDLEIQGPGPIASTNARYVRDSSVVMFDYSLGSFVGLMREKPELIREGAASGKGRHAGHAPHRSRPGGPTRRALRGAS
jgi:hypothetical protein